MAETNETFADVSVERLAKVYAEALLNAAEAKGQVAQVLDEIDGLVDDVLTNEQLQSLLAGSMMGRHARTEAIKKAFAGKISETFYHFLMVLDKHERRDLIRPIRRAIHELSDERSRRLRVHVFSAIPLAADVLTRVRTGIQTYFNLEPKLILHVDPALLGGLKVRIGDRVFDATVRTRLNNLRNQLIERSSHEIQSRRDRFSTAE
jgi:F-type H+-transporting ATPase subunit delta